MHFQSIVLLMAFFACGQGRSARNPPPAPHHEAQMARYIIHNADWVSIASISTQNAIKGYPFVGLKSLSDGPPSNGTGVPYLLMTDMDVSGADLKVDNRCTILATLAQTEYCKNKNLDPQDPRCAKVIMSGKLVKVDKSSPEHIFGMDALYSKHPEMKSWPADHQFYLAKVDLEQIEVLDFFGGIKKVSVENYFKADKLTRRYDIIFERVVLIQI